MSSSNIAISVRDLSKSYTIVHNQKHDTLAETVLERVRNPFRRPERETFWALRGVSFDIEKGEVVGVIGRNGAGKSTLLKVLSRITEPTTGQIDLYGRVGSLLEVGTGFHPELTGRENIYLNGSILGMKRREIDHQFDAIVDFAGTENFLDTPVKRYSSGMYVRLAFAVAAHLNPEILIVDEVLAVGDVAFQNKCLKKMEGVAKEGRTVLLVSHNMSVVSALTQKCLYLESGKIHAYGESREVVQEYIRHARDTVAAGMTDLTAISEEPRVLERIEVLQDGRPVSAIQMGTAVSFRITLSPTARFNAPIVGIGLETPDGLRVLSLSTVHTRGGGGYSENDHVIVCDPGTLPLNQGRYLLTVTVSDGHHDVICDREEQACYFDIIPGDVFGTGHIPNQGQGVVYWPSQWGWRTGEASSERVAL